MSSMKVAIVHELLTMKGGAEKVAKILSEMYPEAPIYTLLYDEKKLGEWFPTNRIRGNIKPTKGFNHHLYLTQFPSVVEHWDFSEFDLVISSSSAFVHGILTNGKPKHLCYVQSPARYLWDRTHDVLERGSKGPLGFLKRWYLNRTFHALRQWDAEVAFRPDMLLAASKEVQRRIELYWRRKSTVVYPPIDDTFFETSNFQLPTSKRKNYLIVSTLVPYKRIDLAIEACNKKNIPLVIAGDGPARKELEKLAGPTVSFAGFVDQKKLIELYASSKALIVPGNEDFALTPLEAMSQGTPVIALKKGGPLETILEGETGEFFEEETVDSLLTVIEKFEHKNYSKEACRARAKHFTRQTFEQGIQGAVSALMN